MADRQTPEPRPAGDDGEVAPWLVPPTGTSLDLAERIRRVVPRVETERLELVAPRMEDFTVFDGAANEEVAPYLPGPFGRQAAWNSFAEQVSGWLLRGHGIWSIRPRGGGRALGFILLGLRWGDSHTELGFLLSQGARGQGYAHEATLAARDFAFVAFGWTEARTYVAPENRAASALCQRLGARLLPERQGGMHVYLHLPEEARHG